MRQLQSPNNDMYVPSNTKSDLGEGISLIKDVATLGTEMPSQIKKSLDSQWEYINE